MRITIPIDFDVDMRAEASRVTPGCLSVFDVEVKPIGMRVALPDYIANRLNHHEIFRMAAETMRNVLGMMANGLMIDFLKAQQERPSVDAVWIRCVLCQEAVRIVDARRVEAQLQACQKCVCERFGSLEAAAEFLDRLEILRNPVAFYKVIEKLRQHPHQPKDATREILEATPKINATFRE